MLPGDDAVAKSIPSATWVLEAALDELDLGDVQLPAINFAIGPDQMLSFEEKCKQVELSQ